MRKFETGYSDNKLVLVMIILRLVLDGIIHAKAYSQKPDSGYLFTQHGILQLFHTNSSLIFSLEFFSDEIKFIKITKILSKLDFWD